MALKSQVFTKQHRRKIALTLLRWQAEMLGIIIIQIKPLVFFAVAVALKSVSLSLPTVCLPASLSVPKNFALFYLMMCVTVNFSIKNLLLY